MIQGYFGEKGELFFEIDLIAFDGQEFTIPVLGGEEIPEFLIGLPWLENQRLVVDRKAGLLTLGED